MLVWALLLAPLAGPGAAQAYNKPWDQGHDSTNPEDPDDPPNPPDPPNNPHGGTGSPLFVRSGNFIKRFIDLSMQACGMPMKITRVYNSFDKRDGLLGFGWTLTYSMRVLDVQSPDGSTHALVLMPNGQRYRFTPNGDGTYTSPPGTIFTLWKTATGYAMDDNIRLTYTFDTEGYLTKMADRSGNEVSFFYRNFAGCIERIEDRTGRAFRFVYGPNGKIQSITDPNGNTVAYEYDTDGNLVSVTDPEGGITTYTYDGHHNLTSIVNGEGETILQVSYESVEPYRVTQYREAGETYTIRYVTGNRTEKTDSAGRTWVFEYMDNGLITRVTTPLGTVLEHGYDAAYNYASFAVLSGGFEYTSLGFGYDGARNLTSVTNALGERHELAYDGQGNVVQITSPDGRAAMFGYAGAQLVRATRPDGALLEVSYSADGYVQRISREGQWVDFSHDSACNLTRLESLSGESVDLEYDTVGNVLAITQQGMRTEYEYNGRNQISAVTWPDGTRTTVAYDSAGRISSVMFPGGGTLGYGYDSQSNRLNRITLPDGRAFQYTFYPFGRLQSQTLPDGTSRSYSYDDDLRLTSVALGGGRSVGYSYDPVGNVTGVRDSKAGSYALTYDAAGRLTGISGPGISWSFGYDAAGQRDLAQDGAGNQTRYSYDSVGRLASVLLPDGSNRTLTPPVQTLPSSITLNDVIGLHNSGQMVRLLSYVAPYVPDGLVRNVSFDLQFLRLQGGVDEKLLTGFSPYELPWPSSFSVPQSSSLMDFLKVYERIGFGW
ncbi:MAG: hypothetical protein Kow0054_05970 [Deferrisoma sp.]